MSTRVEVLEVGPFNAREWLRRDVLWASMMTPYPQQFSGWLNGTAFQQHNGNVSRQNLFATLTEDVVAQSLSFFNQGKNVAGLVSSVALFRASMHGKQEAEVMELLPIQAKSIDKVLSKAESRIERPNDEEVYLECASAIGNVASHPYDEFGNRRRLLRASYIMIGLAAAEAGSWIATSMQNNEENLPVLTINDGGHPRSAGPRVEMLTPIFHQIVASEAFVSLQQ